MVQFGGGRCLDQGRSDRWEVLAKATSDLENKMIRHLLENCCRHADLQSLECQERKLWQNQRNHFDSYFASALVPAEVPFFICSKSAFGTLVNLMQLALEKTSKTKDCELTIAGDNHC